MANSSFLSAALAIASVGAAVSGCALIPEPFEPREPPPAPPPATVAAEAVAEPAPPPPAIEPVAQPAVSAEPVRTAILLSDDIPEFARIAEEIEARLNGEHLTILNLDAQLANVSRIRSEAAEADRIVAIGLLAATVGRQIPETPMVFCQVFNYQDNDLISVSSKGVKMLPPFEMQLESWTELVPDLSQVGIISGPNQDDLVAEIRAASERLGVDLTVRIVSSDQEALYGFKRLLPEIEGLWLLPDNRILSPEVVREIMSYSELHRKQVVVFGANLARLGGLMSVASDPADVAERVLARLERVSADGEVAGPDMEALTRLEITVNPAIARLLNLEVPAALASTAGNNAPGSQ